jgi:vacuolar-type H+-ATPase subunit I/STV1
VAFTIEDMSDLVRLLLEHPEWRLELRRLLLSDELLALPDMVRQLVETVKSLAEAQRRSEERLSVVEERLTRLEETVAALAEAQRRSEERLTRLEETVAALAEAQRRSEERLSVVEERLTRLEETVHTLVIDVAYLKGDSLERLYRERPHVYFSKIIRRAHALTSDELLDLLDKAMAQGLLTEAEAEEVARADVIVRGKQKEDGQEVYLVAEVSWGIGPSDVERAARRAKLLSNSGIVAMPVVAGRAITGEAAGLAKEQNVWQVIDGQVLSLR